MKVKKEEDEHGTMSPASSQQVYSDNVKAWGPGAGPYLSINVSEEEEKVNGLGERKTNAVLR